MGDMVLTNVAMNPGVSIPWSSGGDRADGSPSPTMDLYNPGWARWFNMIKEQTGEYPVFGMRGSSLNKLPTAKNEQGLAPDSTYYTNQVGPQAWGTGNAHAGPRPFAEDPRLQPPPASLTAIQRKVGR